MELSMHIFLFLLLKPLIAKAYYAETYIEDLCRASSTGIWNLGSESSNSSGILKSSRNNTFLSGMNCTIIIHPPLGFGVILSIRHLDFRPYQMPECGSYVQIFDDENPINLCGYSDDPSEYQSYASKEKALELQFVTENKTGLQFKSSIIFIATSYFQVPYSCEMKMFPCENSRCIWRGLKCDGHNNCGDQSDESSRRPASCGTMSPGAVTGIVVGSVMVFLLFILAPFIYCRCCASKYNNSRSSSNPPLIQPAPSYGSSISRTNIQEIEPPTEPILPTTSYPLPRPYHEPPPPYKP